MKMARDTRFGRTHAGQTTNRTKSTNSVGAIGTGPELSPCFMFLRLWQSFTPTITILTCGH